MARQKTNTADWFRFQTDFFQQKIIATANQKFGSQASVVYLYIQCELCLSGSFSLNLTPLLKEDLAVILGIEAAKLMEIVKFFAERGEFDLKKNVLTSPKLIENLEPLLKKREYEAQRYQKQTKTVENDGKIEFQKDIYTSKKGINTQNNVIHAHKKGISAAEKGISAAEKGISAAENDTVNSQESTVKNEEINKYFFSQSQSTARASENDLTDDLTEKNIFLFFEINNISSDTLKIWENNFSNLNVKEVLLKSVLKAANVEKEFARQTCSVGEIASVLSKKIKSFEKYFLAVLRDASDKPLQDANLAKKSHKTTKNTANNEVSKDCTTKRLQSLSANSGRAVIKF